MPAPILPLADATARRALPAAALPGFATPVRAGTRVASAGRVPLARVGHEAARLEFGRERLFRWLNNLQARTPQLVAFVGDSNTQGRWGYALASTEGLFLQLSASGVTAVNHGVSGSTLANWVDNSGTVAGTGKHMAAVLATGPDLLVLAHGGTNEPSSGGTSDKFLGDLDTALATIRTSPNGAIGRLSIVLVANAAQGSGTIQAGTSDMADEYFNAKVRIGMVALTHKHGCAFFDRGGRFPDASVDLATGSVGVNSWIDDYRLHTMGAHTTLLAQEFFDWIAPSVLRTTQSVALVPETGFAQPGSAECLQVRRMPGGTALIEGYVTGPGTVLAAGRAIATVPEGFRPRVQVWQASGLVFASLPMEAAEININTSGVASIARASVASAACVYIRALYST